MQMSIIFEALRKMYDELECVRFSVEIRVQAQLYWKRLEDANRKVGSVDTIGPQDSSVVSRHHLKNWNPSKVLTQEIQPIWTTSADYSCYSVVSDGRIWDTRFFYQQQRCLALHIKMIFIKHLNVPPSDGAFWKKMHVISEYSLYERYHTIADWIEAFVSTQKENSYNPQYIA